MKDRVTFQRRTVTNVGGVGREDWPPLQAPRYPAAVEERQGRQESVIDGNVQTQTARAYTVRCRYRPDVTTDDRAVYHHRSGDRVLQILGLAEEQAGRVLVLDCLEVRA
jgi:head-tail adaptor